MRGALWSHLRTMLSYHRWAYGTLCDRLTAMSDEEYHADAELAFTSVHGTLNHLLLADRLWHGRLIGDPPIYPGLDTILVDEREALPGALYEASSNLLAWLETQDDASLVGPVAYRNMRGDAMELQAAGLLSHVVNHGTHHRGQISAAMTGFGLAAPALDLLYMLRPGA